MNAGVKHVWKALNATLVYLVWPSKALYHSQNVNCETSKKVKFQPPKWWENAKFQDLNFMMSFFRTCGSKNLATVRECSKRSQVNVSKCLFPWRFTSRAQPTIS